jgi:hypothetical protein
MTRRSAGPRRAAWAGAVAGTVLLTACGADEPPRAAPPTAGTATARAAPTTPSTTPAATGPAVQEIADALDAISSIRHPRDNTGSCAAKAGCLGLVTAGTVSIYQWPDVTAATRYIGDGGNADRVGPYVLSYRTREQRSTPPSVREAYADKVRELVGPVA